MENIKIAVSLIAIGLLVGYLIWYYTRTTEDNYFDEEDRLLMSYRPGVFWADTIRDLYFGKMDERAIYDAKNKAGVWTTCACGNLDPGLLEVSGIPGDRMLRDLGLQFANLWELLLDDLYNNSDTPDEQESFRWSYSEERKRELYQEYARDLMQIIRNIDRRESQLLKYPD